MIKILLHSGKSGELVTLTATGHAGCGTFGYDPICAAVSFLLRSLALYLGESCVVEAKARGSFRLEVTQNRFEHSDCNILLNDLQCLGRFTETALKSLAAEYPESVELSIKRSTV